MATLRAVTSALLSFALSFGGVARAASAEEGNTAVRGIAAPFVRAQGVDALSIALVRNESVEFSSFGTATDRSVYEVGSITKLFTSLLLAHAVSEGRISLDADIRGFLPGSYPNLEDHGRPVRVIDLADTTSALPDNLPDFAKITGGARPEDAPALLAAFLDRYSEAKLLEELRSARLVGRPGMLPRHSNVAAELMGIILTRIYGAPFAEMVARYIEGPFGMQSGAGEARAAWLVTGYDAQHRAMPATNQRAILAAGGLRYNIADMARFLRAELDAKSEALRLTQKPAWGSPESSAVGFNWNLSRNTEGALRYHTSGGTLGQASYIEMYPELGYGLVLLANQSGETEAHLQELAQQIFARVEGVPAFAALKTALEESRYRDPAQAIRAVRRDYPKLHLSESFVNQWAGGLMAARPVAALSLFRYNAARWPRSSDAADSLGDGYARLGNKDAAARAYRKALRLNPANGEARESLESLQKKP